MARSNLLTLVKVMFGVLIFSFIYVLASSLGEMDTPPAQADSEMFSNLPIGQTAMRRVAGHRAWLTRPSEQQIRHAISLNAILVDPESGCRTTVDVCILLAATARDGIDLSYSKTAPPQLPMDAGWPGGFVDPTSGAVFDLFGRAYRLGRDSDRQTVQVLKAD